MRITIIGNVANNKTAADGGRIKIRLYVQLLQKEGYEVNVIDLDGWKKRIFSVVSQIKKAIKNKDRIVVMAGPNGCRKILPLIDFLNKKNKAKIVFCPLGIGTLDAVVKNMNFDKAQQFLKGEIEISNSDEKMKRILEKMEFVVLENESLLARYRSYYHLNNLEVLENFRNYSIEPKTYSQSTQLNIVYTSRVKEYKGIMDLISVVKDINSALDNAIKLDIYGDNQLSPENNLIFQQSLDENIVYHGVANASEIFDLIKKYDLFCLPTKYHGEGTSGALIESIIAGTPVLVSAYSQAQSLIKDGESGFIYKFGSNEDLKEKIIWILNNKHVLPEVGKNAQLSGKAFVYEGNRDMFLKIFAGVETL